MKDEKNFDSSIFLPVSSLEEKGPVTPLFDVFLTCGFSWISRVFLQCED